jgi:hypothetical protein
MDGPNHIILDFDHQIAFWFCEAGDQFVHLDQTPFRVEELSEVPDWLRNNESGSRSEPGLTSTNCWQIELCRTSPTLPR